MSNAPTKSAAPGPSSTPVKTPAQTNPVRMGILLGLLFIVLLMLAHHFLFAAPATEKAYNDIQALFDKRNAKGVVSENATEGAKIDAKLVQPKDVQELLGKKPWSTNVEKDYTIETYWWYGMPHQNYITILYYGSGDNLRFNTHYQNAKPPADDLPNAIVQDSAPKTSTPPTTDSDTPSKSGTPANDGASEKPTTDAPAEKPAAEAPAEKPAEGTEEKK